MQASENRKDRFTFSEDRRCIWMTAGILSYELCDREFDCEQCPLDAAMRHQARRATAALRNAEAQAGPETTTPRTNPPQTLYTRSHWWMRRDEKGIVRMGLEPALASALLVPKAVAFPSTGESVRAREACMWIIGRNGTFPLYAPFDGVVVNVNSSLAQNPQNLPFDPYGNGWLIELSVDDAAWENFSTLTHEQADAWYAEDELAFREALVAAPRPGREQVGMTFADGGLRHQDVADLLGGVTYFKILVEVFARHRS